MVDRRVAGEPLEHVVGWAEFCGLRIAVDPGVFVPAPPHRVPGAREARRRRSGSPGSASWSTCAAAPGALGRRARRRGRPGSSCTPPTSTRPPSAAPAATSRRAGGTVYEGDLFEPLPASLRGRVDLLVANAPYVPTDASRADAAGGARPRAARGARRRRRRRGPAPPGRAEARSGWPRAAGC